MPPPILLSLVKRFDRQWHNNNELLRLPQEDCCQALGVSPEHKYEKEGGPGMAAILDFLSASDDPQGDKELFFTAQILYWLLGATDGHAKNFSIHLFPGGGFRLTPLYDVVSLQPNADAGELQWNKMKLAMAIGNNRHFIVKDILPRYFLESAVRSKLSPSKIKNIFEKLLEKIPKALEKTRQAMPKDFADNIADSISRGVLDRCHHIEICLQK